MQILASWILSWVLRETIKLFLSALIFDQGIVSLTKEYTSQLKLISKEHGLRSQKGEHRR